MIYIYTYIFIHIYIYIYTYIMYIFTCIHTHTIFPLAQCKRALLKAKELLKSPAKESC